MFVNLVCFWTKINFVLFDLVKHIVRDWKYSSYLLINVDGFHCIANKVTVLIIVKNCLC